MSLVPPPFDPELAAVLEVVAETLPSTFTIDMVAVARQSMAAARPGPEALDQDGFFEVEDRIVPGPEGAPDISLLIARPAASAGTRPVFYHVHGGGMVIGDNRTGVDTVLGWARELDAVVVSVEYRLAPENPYPAAIEDVYAGLVWTAEHAKEIGGDAERIVIAGTSAGGRPDRGAGPADPGPQGSAADRATADVPDAGRPQRHGVQPPDGGPGRMGSGLQRDGLDRAAR